MSGESNKRKLPGEFALIARYFAPLAGDAKGAAGLKDDAATLAVAPGHELVVTADTLIEGVHFFKNDPADLIARKALRVNLSDLAAKGATPIGYLLALSLADWITKEWVAKFARGLAGDQKVFSLPLLGGDTTATPGPLSMTITALGSVPKGRSIRRAGARVGDRVFVTGTIGDGGAGLAVIEGAGRSLPRRDRDFLVSRYRLPNPRVFLGMKLIGVAHAALDVSDGLVADLAHIAETSGVRIVIDAARIPLSAPFRMLWGKGNAAIVRAATGGDDYEIAFTAPSGARRKLAALGRKADVPITEIGHAEKGRGVVLRDKAGGTISVRQGGFRHF